MPTEANVARIVTLSDPFGTVTNFFSDTNGTGNASTFAYDGYGRMTKQTTPLGMSTGYVYDARGNVTETDEISGGSGPTIKLYANYDATCTNAIKCNHPNWTKDGVGR